jgi:acetyl-CoA acetyltransferase
VLAWAHDTGADLAKTNVNGGAIAIGHPLEALKRDYSRGRLLVPF